jgi:pyroglutamyl-peptidase
MPKNPSGRLAERLAEHGRQYGCDLHAAVLPTEWQAVAALAPRLHADLQPDVMIHFGVDARAEGLRIERSAHNRTARRADAWGALPATRAIAEEGEIRLDTALPVTALSAHLRRTGIAANASRSCGRYLCNFLYYRSLHWAKANGTHALFVHIPLTEAEGGVFKEAALLHAAETTLRFVLDAAPLHGPSQSQDLAPTIEVRP